MSDDTTTMRDRFKRTFGFDELDLEQGVNVTAEAAMSFAQAEVSRARDRERKTVARDIRVVCSKSVDQLVGEIVTALDRAQTERG